VTQAVGVSNGQGYSQVMDLGVNERGEKVVELVAGFIPVSAEGKARARKKLDAARARFDPEARARLKAELGLRPRPTQ
jgi:hypothetical protein